MLYFVSFEGTSMGNAERENFVLQFSRTQENAFLDKLSKIFDSLPQTFLFARKVEMP